MLKIFLIFLFLIFSFVSTRTQDFIIIQSTTSTRDTGFYEYILQKYSKRNSTKIKVVAVGTGQAIKNAKKCDAELLFVHHKPSELDFINKGFGTYREEIMYNDFVLVGPKNDPADLIKTKNVFEAFKKIHKTKSAFISRGDESGTHKKEKELWRNSGIETSKLKNKWFIETGSGMGSSLNMAVNMEAYILTDRSTWITFQNKRNHTIILENEPNLLNLYGIIPINPKVCPNVNFKEAELFVNWLVSIEGKDTIDSFRINGKQLFFSVRKD